ncbi:DMT family transporter [Mangrovimonas sp. YM274]|uniref:DMT family transporter n=1 Tax=Mangrovimonas sp. YM274 TaxID=3070660 RepID=UPI0027DDBC9A|nr:DMT family transporter [Mangrovimonas sp. YM274]WMI68713.1 DMT family transporter [Mangrovimonas sp. YM274]
MKGSHLSHVFWLTLATIFISTSGALGKYIDMPTTVIIWWRSILAAVFLFLYCHFKKIPLEIHSKDRFTFLISGLLMGGHWITYFYALKLSNVAIGMLSLFTFPVITALLEPLFSKVKFDPIHLLLGALVGFGIYMLAPEFSLESGQFKGALFGIASALCYSARILILKQHVARYNGIMLMFYQVAILSFVLLPFIFLFGFGKVSEQFPYVLMLALVTTAIGHTLFIQSLRFFEASTASIISSTQPIFGIIIAYLFLNERPTWNTFIGGTLIIFTVMIESFRSYKKNASV